VVGSSCLVNGAGQEEWCFFFAILLPKFILMGAIDSVCKDVEIWTALTGQ